MQPHFKSCNDLNIRRVDFRCLLDVMGVSLIDMDVYSAEWVSEDVYRPSNQSQSDLIFSSFVVVRQVMCDLIMHICHFLLQQTR